MKHSYKRPRWTLIYCVLVEWSPGYKALEGKAVLLNKIPTAKHVYFTASLSKLSTLKHILTSISYYDYTPLYLKHLPLNFICWNSILVIIVLLGMKAVGGWRGLFVQFNGNVGELGTWTTKSGERKVEVGRLLIVIQNKLGQDVHPKRIHANCVQSWVL